MRTLRTVVPIWSRRRRVGTSSSGIASGCCLATLISRSSALAATCLESFRSAFLGRPRWSRSRLRRIRIRGKRARGRNASSDASGSPGGYRRPECLVRRIRVAGWLSAAGMPRQTHQGRRVAGRSNGRVARPLAPRPGGRDPGRSGRVGSGGGEVVGRVAGRISSRVTIAPARGDATGQTRPFGTVWKYVLLKTIFPRCQRAFGFGGLGGWS